MTLLMVVWAKEVLDNLRDRRTLLSSLIFGPLFGPILFVFMMNFMLNEATVDGLHGRCETAWTSTCSFTIGWPIRLYVFRPATAFLILMRLNMSGRCFPPTATDCFVSVWWNLLSAMLRANHPRHWPDGSAGEPSIEERFRPMAGRSPLEATPTTFVFMMSNLKNCCTFCKGIPALFGRLPFCPRAPTDWFLATTMERC